MIAQNLRGSRFVFVLAVTFVWTIFVVPGCTDMGSASVVDDPVTTNPPPGQPVLFATHVLPVFQRNGCTSCHGGSGGLFVTSVAQLLRGGDHGPPVVSGKAETSILIRKLSAGPPFGERMPQGGPYLPDSTVQLIARWINEGAKDN